LKILHSADFGSLDPESLDTALKTLIDLRQSGRMVGIISHVENLKRQIDVGIEIKSGIKGSKVTIFGGASAP
jgi:exonuclease SbcC